jgi:hypothetical protein
VLCLQSPLNTRIFHYRGLAESRLVVSMSSCLNHNDVAGIQWMETRHLDVCSLSKIQLLCPKYKGVCVRMSWRQYFDLYGGQSRKGCPKAQFRTCKLDWCWSTNDFTSRHSREIYWSQEYRLHHGQGYCMFLVHQVPEQCYCLLIQCHVRS